MILLHGDCLKEHISVTPESVDLILTDLPYGTMENIDAGSFGMSGRTGWDTAIAPAKVYMMAEYMLRKKGKMVLFSQEPYTTLLTGGALPNTPFSYRMIWKKDHFANCLVAKKAPVSFYEDLLVFNKTHQKYDLKNGHPLRSYFEYIFNAIGVPKQAIINTIGPRACHVFRFSTSQFALCTEGTYSDLIRVYRIDRIDGFVPFGDLKQSDANYNAQAPSIFNLWQGGKYKSNILEYKKDYGGLHPTQKPVALLEDLIKTFSNAGDTVADLTMGSGSTGVAAVRTKRKFIGIELDEKYFNTARDRINLEIIGAS